jgi:hypothetical protein
MPTPRISWHRTTWPILAELHTLSQRGGSPSHNTLINIAVRRLGREIATRGLPAVLAEEAAAILDTSIGPHDGASEPNDKGSI